MHAIGRIVIIGDADPGIFEIGIDECAGVGGGAAPARKGFGEIGITGAEPHGIGAGWPLR